MAGVNKREVRDGMCRRIQRGDFGAEGGGADAGAGFGAFAAAGAAGGAACALGAATVGEFGEFKSKNPVRSRCPASVSTSWPLISILSRRAVGTLLSSVREIESITTCSLSIPEGVSAESGV